MVFPRILSKNNKVYTKLGEFCLSSDGSFYIVCQVCQEELHTQGQFLIHIQDEHNLMHGIGIKQEQQEASRSFISDASNVHVMPLPLYRELNEEEQRAAALGHAGDSSQDQHEAKYNAEMRSTEANAVGIDIKIEPPSAGQALPLPPPAPGIQSSGIGQQQAMDVSAAAVAAATIYQLLQVPPAYAAIAHTAAPPMNIPAQQTSGGIWSQEMPRVSNSTTRASASSAMSSNVGQRWYVCDFESCGRKFKYQSRLAMHRSVHSNERLFVCDICGASYKYSCHLTTHRKNKHFIIKGVMHRF